MAFQSTRGRFRRKVQRTSGGVWSQKIIQYGQPLKKEFLGQAVRRRDGQARELKTRKSTQGEHERRENLLDRS